MSFSLWRDLHRLVWNLWLRCEVMRIFLQIPQREREIAEREEASSSRPSRRASYENIFGQSNYWLRQNLIRWRLVERLIHELIPLLEEATFANDADVAEKIPARVQELRAWLEDVENDLLLEEEYDGYPALLFALPLSPTDQDRSFARRLMWMYRRWAQRRGLEAVPLGVVEEWEGRFILGEFPASYGSSSLLSLRGRGVFGLLKGEAGLHQLHNGEETSRVRVKVYPDLEEEAQKHIREREISWSSERALAYMEETLSFQYNGEEFLMQCEEEKFRSSAGLMRLVFRILRGWVLVDRGSPREQESLPRVRSYTLGERPFVHDHRTGQIFGNLKEILDGKIEPFLRAYLRRSLAPLHLDR